MPRPRGARVGPALETGMSTSSLDDSQTPSRYLSRTPVDGSRLRAARPTGSGFSGTHQIDGRPSPGRSTTWEGPHVSESVVSTTPSPETPAAGPESSAGSGARRGSGGGLSAKLLPELKQMAGGLGIKGASTMKKAQLIDAIRSAQGGSQGGQPAKDKGGDK